MSLLHSLGSRTPVCSPRADDAFGPFIDGCRQNFDFTLLFEQSILTIVPSIVLLILTPLRLLQLYRSNAKTLPNRIYTAKLVVSLGLVGLQLSLLVLWILNKNTQTKASIPSATLSFIAAVAVLCLSSLEHARSVQPSSLLNIFLLLSIILDLAQARTLFLRRDDAPIAWVFFATMVVKLGLLVLEAQSKRPYLKSPYRDQCPEATSGIFNRSVFWWLNSLFHDGFRKLLSFDDLYTLDTGLMSEPLREQMQSAWEHRSKPEGKYSLVFVTIWFLRWPLLLAAFPRLCLIGFTFAQPFLITTAIGFVSGSVHSQPASVGYALIGATALIYLGIAISTVHYKHKLFRSIAMFRGAVVSVIYQRTLLLQAGAYDESAAVTLMSSDVDRIAKSMEVVHEVWAQFLEVCIGIALLARELGWVSIMPLVIVGLCSFGSSKVASRIGGRMQVWTASVQRRIAMTSSMLGSMKAVKMMGLTSVMTTTIQAQRIRELNLAIGYRWCIVWLNVFGVLPEAFAPVVTFITFAIQAKVHGTGFLSTAQVFTSLAIIALVTSPASQLLTAVPTCASALGCFNRIQAFLSAPVHKTIDRSRHGSLKDAHLEKGSDTSDIELQSAKSDTASRLGSLAVRVENADILPSSGSDFSLQDINLDIQKGSLTMIIGPIGSGKSTLMKAILGELPCSSGTIFSTSFKTAYCAQTPWLLNTSVQRNICGLTTNSTVDEKWYSTVLFTCALDTDIQNLPEGDQTIVGSRGIALSGGQKQRVALARALYARNDIVLLDDVLSALDSETERMVVDRLLGPRGIFRKLGITVILITHATQHLRLADKVVILTMEGRIDRQGTYETLKLKGDLNIGEEKSNESTSATSTKPKDKSSKATTIDQAQDLTRRTGDVSLYIYYLKSVGWGDSLLFLILSLATLFGMTIFPPIWLNLWAQDDGSHTSRYIVVYILVAMFAGIMVGSSIWSMMIRISPKSSIQLHHTLLRTVMRAPLSFFAKTDTGTTINRFSQDMTLIESTLPTAVLVAVTTLLQSLGQAALVSTGSTYMALSIPFFLFAIYILQKVYLRTSRQLRYLDLEARSPLYSHFLESLDGLSTIRAFGWQDQSSAIETRYLDASQRPYYLMFCIQRWLNLVLDLMIAVLAIVVVSLATSLRGSTSGGLLGIALNNILGFNQSLSQLVNYWTQLETSLGAIARLKTFEKETTPEERDGEDVRPSEQWPEYGAIEFKNVSASYGPNIPALRNISMSINPGEKVGICGRTGSGKSSLLATLLRLLDLAPGSGTIFIDGVDIQVLPRELIRERIVAIPQDPFMLNGTVRLNMDPHGKVPDDLIVDVLSKLRLWPIIQGRGGLNADINAQPLSQGQQQLFCLGRAMLRKGMKILVLDEATSNVDKETDQVMQKIIREEFRAQTIITIAHRLDTIMDSDRIAVFDSGRLVEFDRPGALLGRESVFKTLTGR